MKLNMVSGKSVGEFSNQLIQGSPSNKNSRKGTKFSCTVCYFVRLSLNLENIAKFL